jgi:hypothetical protein
MALRTLQVPEDHGLRPDAPLLRNKELIRAFEVLLNASDHWVIKDHARRDLIRLVDARSRARSVIDRAREALRPWQRRVAWVASSADGGRPYRVTFTRTVSRAGLA